MSAAILFALVFTGGFVGKVFSREHTWRDVFSCFNLGHLAVGSVLTGCFSLLGWVVSFCSVGGGLHGGRSMFWWSPNFGGGGRSDGDLGKVLLVIVVVIGLCIALSWIYTRVAEYADRMARHAQHVVLDAYHLQRRPDE